MSLIGQALKSCPSLQAELNAYFQTCNAAELGDVSPLVQFLYSPINRSGIQQLVQPEGGKLRQVVLRYDQLIPESEVQSVDSCDRICTTTDKRGDLVATYEIDPCAKLVVSEAMALKDFYQSCLSNPEIIMGKLRRLINALRARTQTKLVNELTSLTGKWSGTVSASGLNVVSDQLVIKTKLANGNINPEAIADIDMAVLQTGYCSPPAIFSGGTLYRYARAMQAGCCADSGLDLEKAMQLFGKAIMFDRRVQQEWSVDEAVVLMPGAVQVLEFNEFAGDAEFFSAAGVSPKDHTEVIIDPATGMAMNLLISENCGTLSFILHTVTRLVNMPSDMFPAGHYMEGVNYVNEILVDNS
jgi:hypothetical protein